MRTTIFCLIAAIFILSCNHKTKESFISIPYKTRGIIVQENISPTLSYAQTKLMLLRDIEKMSPAESADINCRYNHDLDSVMQLLSPEEKSSLADFRNKLKADINFPYTNERDSGTFEIKTSTAYQILKNGKNIAPCK